MSGTTFGPVTPTAPGPPIVPQGYLGQGNLLQTNTTLLQPIPSSFRLFETVWLLMMSTLTTTPAIQPLEETVEQLESNTIGADLEMRHSIADLQRQIAQLNERLTAAGIA